MLVNLTKDELKKIIWWLDMTTDKPLADKLRPTLDACECQAQKKTSPPN
tara:strand:- start:316 stop:462 length:147 start_codon:yes stop_codon:yes gene_type:complete